MLLLGNTGFLDHFCPAGDFGAYKLLEYRAYRHGRMRRQDVRRGANARNRGKIAQRIVGRALVQQWRRGSGGNIALKQRVTIRR